MNIYKYKNKGAKVFRTGLFVSTFLILMLAGNAAGVEQTFTNPNVITIPDSGPASPYPSNIAVAGLSGNILKVTVKLNSLEHTFTKDIDVLLVGPNGNAIIMSDVGNGYPGVSGVTLTLDDTAANFMPDESLLVTGTYKPTNIGDSDVFPFPAPSPSGGSALTVFKGIDPNGVWSLYVVDDIAFDGGAFINGWELTITTDDTQTQGIPEFPTMALPVISVIALMFFVVRRKHN